MSLIAHSVTGSYGYCFQCGQRRRCWDGAAPCPRQGWPVQQRQQRQQQQRQQHQHQHQHQHQQIFQGRHRQGSRLGAAPGLADDEVDVAVFRFTLGIPGFDDSNTPKVVGAVVAALVAANHVLGADPAPPAQMRAEFLDITLAALCFVVPEIEARLRQVQPGRGRSGVGEIAGSAQLFALAEGLDETARKELAWASFALLKNVNCCSVLLLDHAASNVLLARGAVARDVTVAGDQAASLTRVAQAYSSSSTAAAGLLPAAKQQWLPEKAAVKQSGLGSIPFVPEGVQSALVQPLPGGLALLVLAERPRALSEKDRKWVAAIANKLGGILQQ
eukprot:GHRR01006485.1.p1 GENE.GHRR01006485.1~~GHRR01006485.1.p1  ORF type:complete len:331 (+),score=129.47 GHRR01006485.1:317-1309(+)